MLFFCPFEKKKKKKARAPKSSIPLTSIHPSSPDPRHPDYLIYQICHSEPLVRWSLDHGAHLSYPDVDSHTPILDSVARSGTLAIVKLLLDHGAKLGRRTLHMAVCSAAVAGEEELDRKMELVRFLVEEKGCDVDGMDVDMEKGERLGNHYGTPLNYVAHASGNGSPGEERVVRYLLEVSFSLSIYLSITIDSLPFSNPSRRNVRGKTFPRTD